MLPFSKSKKVVFEGVWNLFDKSWWIIGGFKQSDTLSF